MYNTTNAADAQMQLWTQYLSANLKCTQIVKYSRSTVVSVSCATGTPHIAITHMNKVLVQWSLTCLIRECGSTLYVGMAQGVSLSLYIGIGAKFENTQKTGERRLRTAEYRTVLL